MSGGHWEYKQYEVAELLKEIGHDKNIQKRFPSLAKFYLKLSVFLGENLYKLDWDLSGDTTIPSDKLFEETSIKLIKQLLGIK